LVNARPFGGGLSEAVAGEREPVGVVNEAIEDGIRDGRITEHL
jgi:hypothetical protein